MKKLFTDTRLLDKACRENYGLTEELMMENAAAALETAVLSKCQDDFPKTVLILTGSGNNGGDGFALARRLFGKVSVFLYCVSAPKSQMCILQADRAEKLGVKKLSEKALSEFLPKIEIIVDCIYGSGFHGKLDEKTADLLEEINACKARKIACDIPSGIDSLGFIETQNISGGKVAFKADETITMGALKTALFSDFAKDFCGKIICTELGINRSLFEAADSQVLPEAFLLEKVDLKLPLRKQQNVNKGTFGHTAIILGEKPGAAIIAGSAAFAFGSGLVTLVSADREKRNFSDKTIAGNDALPVACPPELMQNFVLPANTKATAIGMGLGISSKAADDFLSDFYKRQTENAIPAVFDADMFSKNELSDFLELSNSRKIQFVLTPHPKEFVQLLKATGFGDFSIQDAVKNRISLSKKFVEKFPNIILLVKGSNVCISHKTKEGQIETAINPFGDACLAKGGSGDVLAGLIAALLAQGYSGFDAAVSASLAHAIASENFSESYSLTPFLLIEKIRDLKN